MTIRIIREVLETHRIDSGRYIDGRGYERTSHTEKCTGCPWIGWDHRLHVAKMIDAAVENEFEPCIYSCDANHYHRTGDQ